MERGLPARSSEVIADHAGWKPALQICVIFLTQKNTIKTMA
jgi:hypothetical protein